MTQCKRDQQTKKKHQKSTTATTKRRHKAKAIDHLDFLSLVGRNTSRKLRKALLELANRNQIEAILECVENVNNGNVRVPPHKVKSLRRHSNLVHKLKRPHTSLTEKKRLLSQKGGGFLAALLPLALSTLAPYVVDPILKAIGLAPKTQ